uniref:Putative proteasome beta type-4 subunit n=1 Tax=Ixodes ricinus TaxID=34613 RepID=V5H948_IXORI
MTVSSSSRSPFTPGLLVSCTTGGPSLIPLWNTYLVGGLQDGVPFLGQVDMLGTAFQSDTLATGYGAYIAQPLMRDDYEKKGGHRGARRRPKGHPVKVPQGPLLQGRRSLDKVPNWRW